MEKRIEDEKVFSESSYAKINLFLEVHGKQDDGFHNIRSIFSEIDLFDEMTFSHALDLFVETNSPIDMQDNIVYKTAALIKSNYNVNDGAHISINKKIPIAAGLGGGSSNAACTIKALSSLWNLSLSPAEMNTIASELGSDITFFLTGGTAIGVGRGNIIHPLEDIDIHRILLVKPHFGISSSFAYNNLTSYGNNQDWENITGMRTDFTKYLFNRLEASIRIEYPEIDRIITYMTNKGAVKSLLSGSGSTVFGVYETDDIYNQHCSYFKSLGYWVYQTRTKSRNDSVN